MIRPSDFGAKVDQQWDALCKAARAAELELPSDDYFVEEIQRVFAFSDFVARNCIRDPVIASSLLKTGDLSRSYRKDEYRDRLKAALAETDSVEAFVRKIRQVRRYEMIRIAWRDLAGRADYHETVADLSAFADACIDRSLSFLYPQMCRQLGTPYSFMGLQQNLVVIGMGKLGGRELNFSSDVDLVFAYPETGETRNGPSSVGNDEFFTRLARELLKMIGSALPGGMVFRTDMRLRPYGEGGPLVMSFDAMETYYQMQGREWERYAWIKARVVAGDTASGNELLQRLKPFVYRRYFDYGAFESLRSMKRQIVMESRRSGIANDIKLGSGGIREIEFFGQIFQLLRGGVEPALQKRGILDILRVLARNKYISSAAFEEMEQAYIFLRNSEHRLQEFADRQTHGLPQDSDGKLRLAAAMGFESWALYEKKLTAHMNSVHAHFNRLLAPKEAAESDNISGQQLAGLWHRNDETEENRKILTAAGFNRPGSVFNLLEELKRDPATRSLSGEGRERLDRLVPLVLHHTGKSGKPLSNLNRIVELIKTIERRTCYLALLTENPIVLEHLIKLAEASPWILSFLTRHPVLLDELLDPRTLYVPPGKDEMAGELHQRLRQAPSQDLERQIEELCIFKQIQMLRVAAADVTGVLPLMRVSDHLTEIAETILAYVIEISWRHLTEKHGLPDCSLEGKTTEKGFTVIAYGKLGGLELGYDSDLDLVFLHAGTRAKNNDPSDSIDAPQFFARLGQRVVHILTAHTPAGFLYETDMRLRPSGSAGLLVSQVEAYARYQAEEAWTWEHQALVRARVVYGDVLLADYFARIREKVLARPRDSMELRQAISQMRERLREENRPVGNRHFDLKQGAGGVVDIEFLVQYLVLLNAHLYPELLKWTDNVRLLESLAETGCIEATAAGCLREAYLTYRSAIHKLSLQEAPASVAADRFKMQRKQVIELWNRFIAA